MNWTPKQFSWPNFSGILLQERSRMNATCAAKHLHVAVSWLCTSVYTTDSGPTSVIGVICCSPPVAIWSRILPFTQARRYLLFVSYYTVRYRYRYRFLENRISIQKWPVNFTKSGFDPLLLFWGFCLIVCLPVLPSRESYPIFKTKFFKILFLFVLSALLFPVSTFLSSVYKFTTYSGGVIIVAFPKKNV
jgi:hypothetical protein